MVSEIFSELVSNFNEIKQKLRALSLWPSSYIYILAEQKAPESTTDQGLHLIIPRFLTFLLVSLLSFFYIRVVLTSVHSHPMLLLRKSFLFPYFNIFIFMSHLLLSLMRSRRGVSAPPPPSH